MRSVFKTHRLPKKLSAFIEIIRKKEAGIDLLAFQHLKTSLRHKPCYSLPAAYRKHSGMIKESAPAVVPAQESADEFPVQRRCRT
jgi:hypothetical protein